MKLDEIPDAIMFAKWITPTRESILRKLAKHGPATTTDVFRLVGATTDQKRADVISVLSVAFDEGLVTLHHTNAGQRGRPKYEWNISENPPC